MKFRITAVSVAAALALAGCGGAGNGGPAASSTPSTTPSPVMVTSFPDLPAPTGEPDLPGIATAAPASAGSVGRIPGPFDDRVSLGPLSFDGQRVVGSLDVTSDVSDLLELQVLAGFYDASGTLVGRGRFTHHLDEDTHHDDGPPSQHEAFTIAVPKKLRGQAVSAAVGVPVLVNE
ncbi:hypothetical protein [Nocardioides daeguensis]|uniref:Bacterial spore germination immunoglobulin-like domain-containing protein n=1 Tax=Nocardioides daeguensis TaxID=908359 RepID=A0ABP6VGC6_9ACTN|nr:hypothetical protein [Nocardioides daeguensis]MBV6729482.1 hypothetical protein [Nocardioides daeguensis]MCR1771745.1 hypothetical protein [Nocardioides daeguensis]